MASLNICITVHIRFCNPIFRRNSEDGVAEPHTHGLRNINKLGRVVCMMINATEGILNFIRTKNAEQNLTGRCSY